MTRKKQKKKFSFKEQYSRSWDYIKESRKFIYAVIIIFFVFTFVGFFIPAPGYIYNQLTSYIKELALQASNLSGIQLILFIFFNNLKSSFFGIIFGIFFGIFPAFIALFNGYILGFVANESVRADGALVLLRLLPHGIFELSAIFISLGVGMRLGGLLFKKDKNLLKENLFDALRVFLLVVVPLLIAAAIIEGGLIILTR